MGMVFFAVTTTERPTADSLLTLTVEPTKFTRWPVAAKAQSGLQVLPSSSAPSPA